MSTNLNVISPAHYTLGKIQVWDFIKDQALNYDRGAAVKYICRAGRKIPEGIDVAKGLTYEDRVRLFAKEIEDIEKAVAYLQHELLSLAAALEEFQDLPDDV